jgi:hypothetical protein
MKKLETPRVQEYFPATISRYFWNCLWTPH